MSQIIKYYSYITCSIRNLHLCKTKKLPHSKVLPQCQIFSFFRMQSNRDVLSVRLGPKEILHFYVFTNCFLSSRTYYLLLSRSFLSVQQYREVETYIYVSDCTCCIHVFSYSGPVLRCRQSLRPLIHHQAKVARCQQLGRTRKACRADGSFLRYLDTTLRFVCESCSVILEQNSRRPQPSVSRKVAATHHSSNFDISLQHINRSMISRQIIPSFISHQTVCHFYC